MTSADEILRLQGLLDDADDLLASGLPATQGLWPRAAAFLIRLALEQAIDNFWTAKARQMRECSRHAQLICLRSYLDKATAGRVTELWESLSGACHYHTYELAPTAAELRSWHNEAKELVAALATQ